MLQDVSDQIFNMSISQRVENVLHFAPPGDQPRLMQQLEPRGDAAEFVSGQLNQVGDTHFASRQAQQQMQPLRIGQGLEHGRHGLDLAPRVGRNRAEFLGLVSAT